MYAYIIDTGIYTSHSQFGGRASNVYDALGGNGQDCHGHGTHVAGTVGASTYGVAKAVRLRGLRVLDCSGSGTTSGIIAAVDWVRVNRVNPAVANMCLGGGYSSALNTAVTNLHNSGVFVAVAAGNTNANACNYSPASAADRGERGVEHLDRREVSFSNYGSCVDLYAPGSSITSTWLNGGTNTISGTSMASPHVAGVGGAVQGHLRQRVIVHDPELDHQQRHPQRDHGQPAGHAQQAAVQGDAVNPSRRAAFPGGAPRRSPPPPARGTRR